MLNELIEKVTEYANENHDGHYTIMKFTTNYRACFGTVHEWLDIQSMREGNTLEEALERLLADPIDSIQISQGGEWDDE